jgi:prevent-host-death family protein
VIKSPRASGGFALIHTKVSSGQTRNPSKNQTLKVTPCEVAIQARQVPVLDQEGGSRFSGGGRAQASRQMRCARPPGSSFLIPIAHLTGGIASSNHPPTSQGCTKATPQPYFHPKIAKLTILAYADLMTMTATKAKDQLANLLERARTAGERIVIEKHGKPVAVLVSIEDLKRLERLDMLERAAQHRPLAGTVLRFGDPFEPVSGDWTANQ